MAETSADRLRRVRALAGYETASDAARAYGWKVSTYLAHENGQNGFKIVAAVKYGRAYHVPPGWLLTGEGLQGSYFESANNAADYNADTVIYSTRKGARVDPIINFIQQGTAGLSNPTALLEVLPHAFIGAVIGLALGLIFWFMGQITQGGSGEEI